MSTISEFRGNIFQSSCQTLVNTVNCVGVMGKGIALEFKNRFPEMYDEYARYCADQRIRPGILHLWKKSEPWILNFPTKNHWKYPSKIEYIELGMAKFSATYTEKGITSIAFPELGTSLGGLQWITVKEVMYQFLEPLPNLEVEIITLIQLPKGVTSRALRLENQQVTKANKTLNSGEQNAHLFIFQQVGRALDWLRPLPKIHSSTSFINAFTAFP